VSSAAAPAPSASADVPAPASTPFKLTVTAVVQGSPPSSLFSTKLLHDGAHFYFSLRASQPTNAYVAYCDSRHTLSVYPTSGSLAVGPDSDVRAPDMSDFELDNQTGQENIFVIASRDPLTKTDPRLARALNIVTDGAQACATAAMERPGVARPSSSAPAAKTDPPGAKPRAQEGPGQRPRPVVIASMQLAVPDVDPVFRPRGVHVGASIANAEAVNSDEAGIAILPLTFRHEQ